MLARSCATIGARTVYTSRMTTFKAECLHRLRPCRHTRPNNAARRAGFDAGVALHRPTYRGCRAYLRQISLTAVPCKEMEEFLMKWSRTLFKTELTQTNMAPLRSHPLYMPSLTCYISVIQAQMHRSSMPDTTV